MLHWGSWRHCKSTQRIGWRITPFDFYWRLNLLKSYCCCDLSEYWWLKISSGEHTVVKTHTIIQCVEVKRFMFSAAIVCWELYFFGVTAWEVSSSWIAADWSYDHTLHEKIVGVDSVVEAEVRHSYVVDILSEGCKKYFKYCCCIYLRPMGM